MILLKKVKMKNFFSVGNVPIEIDFKKGVHHVSGSNGSGKCVDPDTILEVKFENDTLKDFLEWKKMNS